MEELLWNSEHINAWIKDPSGRYLKASEGFALHAGLDSPKEIIGKQDHELIWQKNVQRIYHYDKMALAGLPVKNSHQIIQTKHGLKTILVNKHTENKLLIGNAVDITGKVLMQQQGRWNIKTGMFELGSLTLTHKEVDVIRLLLIGQSGKLIAAKLNIHEKTAEQRIDTLRRKFRAGSKVALTEKLHSAGLTYLAMQKDQFML